MISKFINKQQIETIILNCQLILLINILIKVALAIMDALVYLKLNKQDVLLLKIVQKTSIIIIMMNNNINVLKIILITNNAIKIAIMKEKNCYIINQL